jgi:L-aspartate oxidase
MPIAISVFDFWFVLYSINLMIYDVVIIGSGAAGLTLALNLASHNYQVALLSKGSLTEGNTTYAQGGIAAVTGLNKKDSIESHIADTLTAGAGLSDPEIVRFVVTNAKAAIDWLIEEGVQFTKCEDKNEYHLTCEGGHSHRRILHAKDATGQEVESVLAARVRTNSNITIFEEHTSIDLIKQNERCTGVYAFNNLSNHVGTIQGKCVVLATGGASKVYLYTSNPDSASGDGIAMAYRAGCTIKNMEFNQFHPTCLYHPKAKSFLISESVRGEGGILLLPNGKRFMQDFDSRGEMATRDVVTRAIDYVIKRYGLDCVYLDISHKPKDFIIEHFPTIYHKCLEFGFDMTKEPLPIVPAAHFTCGGVVTDVRARTGLPGLYAIGEVACTGLHGANRLASNSLLECLVFGHAAYQDINAHIATFPTPESARPWDESQVTDSDEEIVVPHNWQELRRMMWDYVGIVRTNKRLARAAHRVTLLKNEIQEYYGNFRVTKNLIELRNLVVAADLIIKAAQSRKENIGLHYNLDNINE